MATSMLNATSLDFQSTLNNTQSKITSSASGFVFEGPSGGDISITGIDDISSSGTITGFSFTDGTATISGGAISDVTTLDVTDDVTLAKDAAAITHSGATSLVISSTNGNVSVEDVVFAGGAVSGVTTLDVTDDVTLAKDSAVITHSGTTSLAISSTNGNVSVENVNFDGGAVSGVTTLVANGTITGNTITDGTATISGGAITGVSFTDGTATISGGAVSGVSFTDGTATLQAGVLSGLVTPVNASHAANKQYVDDQVQGLSAGLPFQDTISFDAITANITHTALSGSLVISSTNGTVSVENVNFDGGAVSGVTTLVANGTITGNTITDGTATISGGAITGVSFTDGSAMISGGAVSGVTTLSASGIVSITNDTNSAQFTDGALVVNGGIGVAKDVRSNGEMYAVAFNATSDENFKQDIMDIDMDDLEKLMNVRAVSYRFKGISDESKTRYGILAQDLEEKGLGHMVTTDIYGTKKVNYNDLVGLLIGQVKDLKHEIDVLKNLRY